MYDRIMANKAARSDWDEIKNEYITTTISSRELARKYGMSETNMRLHRTKEGWDEEREKLRKAKAKKAIDEALKAQGDLAKLATNTLETVLKKLSMAAAQADSNDVRTLKDISAAMAQIKELGMYEVKATNSNVEVSFTGGGSDYAD